MHKINIRGPLLENGYKLQASDMGGSSEHRTLCDHVDHKPMKQALGTEEKKTLQVYPSLTKARVLGSHLQQQIQLAAATADTYFRPNPVPSSLDIIIRIRTTF